MIRRRREWTVLVPSLALTAILGGCTRRLPVPGSRGPGAISPEKAAADRLGIRVAIVGDAKEHSTRGLLQSVRQAPHD